MATEFKKSDLRQIVYALSDALDLVGIDDVAHGKRVGIMASECAQTMGLSGEETRFLFDLGLLHDIGVSSTRTHHHLISEFDWEGSQVHAEAGHALLKDFPPLARMATPILHHHTRWERLPAVDASEEQKREANLIFLADRVDAFASPHYGKSDFFDHVEEIRKKIEIHSGVYFSPELVKTFLKASEAEAFWLLLEPRAIQNYLRDKLAEGSPYQPQFAELRMLGVIFSHIVDAKSPFTVDHSMGVARLARHLGKLAGVSEENCDKLEIAGLLHDLGKLRIPDEILDKPGGLDRHERLIINTHSFETYQILHGIGGFEEIALWAAYHHEEPNGKGYPFHVKEQDLSIEARILRVADIVQALVQNRPYRKGLPMQEVLEYIEKLTAEGRLDADIVSLVQSHAEDSMAAALSA